MWHKIFKYDEKATNIYAQIDQNIATINVKTRKESANRKKEKMSANKGPKSATICALSQGVAALNPVKPSKYHVKPQVIEHSLLNSVLVW